MNFSEWLKPETVAIKATAVYFGVPSQGHLSCSLILTHKNWTGPLEQVTREEPDIEKKHCIECGKLLIPEGVSNEDQGNACKEGIEQVGFTLITEDGKPYLSVNGQTGLKVRCHYDKEREGVYQCPKCKHWYCEECREMWLPIDPMFPGVETAMMCPQCHYETYGRGDLC